VSEHGVLSVLPSVIALSIALATRRVILSLGIGVWVGMTIHRGYNPLAGLFDLLDKGLFAQLGTKTNAAVVVLICLIAGFVQLIERSGGIQSFAARAARLLTSPRKAQLAVWLAGIGIFFTDSGTSLILGPLFRPVFRGFGLCREKLAFLLDSTSSPVSVLVPITSWGVYIMSLIEQSYRDQQGQWTAFGLWLEALPYQLYPILAVGSVPLFIAFGREFGPMARRQALLDQGAHGEEPAPPSDGAHESVVEQAAPATLVTVPLTVLFCCLTLILGYFWLTSGRLPSHQLQTALGIAYGFALLSAALLLRVGERRRLAWAFATVIEGVGKVLPIVLILLLAWSLGDVCRLLGTGAFVASAFEGALPPFLLPGLVFLIGVFLSLATGSSWGTYAIVFPIAASVASRLGIPAPLAIGAVLSGGMFGDHTSPISDTTILSSMASGCEHADHVNTQIPYAAFAGLSSLIGFCLAGLVTGPWLLPATFALQASALSATFVWLRTRGQAA
jgi:Na+/H+ antiporter NhaC